MTNIKIKIHISVTFLELTCLSLKERLKVSLRYENNHKLYKYNVPSDGQIKDLKQMNYMFIEITIQAAKCDVTIFIMEGGQGLQRSKIQSALGYLVFIKTIWVSIILNQSKSPLLTCNITFFNTTELAF